MEPVVTSIWRSLRNKINQEIDVSHKVKILIVNSQMPVDSIYLKKNKLILAHLYRIDIDDN